MDYAVNHFQASLSSSASQRNPEGWDCILLPSGPSALRARDFIIQVC